MARQKGVIKLKGTIGDISFYKTQDGYLARERAVLKRQGLRMIQNLCGPVKTVLSSGERVLQVKFFEMRFGWGTHITC